MLTETITDTAAAQTKEEEFTEDEYDNEPAATPQQSFFERVRQRIIQGASKIFEDEDEE